ncbi:ribonuclease H-like YkuK family protein [uncultured Tenacibaculum sp.]|uniref:ribonuclease H-like YkuK family protein n=1 Tax=uncultured Tenacibaculum sp. TaxID=174713 RepID=UPI002616666D|nr:ribonuclease H-like YkuK family protein [uncultured Tenacibaculum sp.]
MKTVKQKWRNFSGKEFDESITTIIEKAIVREQKEGYNLKICVGSDSQAYKSHIEYATAIVVLREGKGGFMFMRNLKGTKQISIKERMLKEVTMSVETAYAICNILDKYNVALEVHADINTDPKFQSNVALKDAMGYILGMGFEFKAKPYAFASSSCADKVV